MFFQFLANGILIGCSYTLVALGLTLIFSILNVLNFAHGEIVMFGAYATFCIMTLLKVNFYFALVLSMALTALFGVLVEKLVFRPLYGKEEMSMFLVSIGLIFIIRYSIMLVLGTEPRTIETAFAGRVLQFFDIYFTYDRVTIILLTTSIIFALHIFINRTKMGKAIRAVSQNSFGAGIVGINTNFISSFTFAIGCSLAAVAGSFLGVLYIVSPEMGHVPLIKAFTIIVLGGLGSIVGTIVAGFVLGITESLAGGFFLYEYKDAISFIILILVLLVKPTGLFGKK